MRTIFYIDGFNLYYGACRREEKKYRWLDIAALCRRLMQDAEIAEIKYFTARIKNSESDSYHQNIYLRALRTLPKVSIIYGNYLKSTPVMRVKTPPPDSIRVIKNEEKGTDVNIASHMILDALDGAAQRLALVSNDSDLVFPVREIISRWQIPVEIFSPRTTKCAALECAATSMNIIHTGTIARCMLPDTVTDHDGAIITKPPHW